MRQDSEHLLAELPSISLSCLTDSMFTVHHLLSDIKPSAFSAHYKAAVSVQALLLVEASLYKRE
jgi:hypothetical protein